jgi:stearoyl-CoA desaturase (delta-9 desaturase)
MFGLLQLPWWGYILVLLGLTQITILSVTIYLHRCQAHRALELHPIVSHFFRFWLWLTTGMGTKAWTAIHRKHHAKVETAEDPHSPIIKGIKQVLFEGAELYRKEAVNQETLTRYGQGTPDDWVEQRVYSHSALGIYITLAVNLILFGPIGLTIWALQMAWIPFFAAGVVNGIGHYWGYRNFECKDAARNVFPIGFFIGGEELHNNHHAYATSAKFSAKWWEFDLGWLVIRLLQLFRLAKPKRILPKPHRMLTKTQVDIDTLKAIILYRFQVMSRYAYDVMLPLLNEEKKRAGKAGGALLRRARTILIRDDSIMQASQKIRLEAVLNHFHTLRIVYQLRMKLQDIWGRSTATQKELLEALQKWCQEAEAAGIPALLGFVYRLKTYVPPAESKMS